MNILLVYPQYVHHSSYDARSPSLSLLYLASRLEKDNHQVKIFDASLGSIKRTGEGFLYGMGNEEVAKELQNESFDLVGITCSFASRWPFVASLAKMFKELHPGIPVVTGGLFPTYDWTFCLEQSRDIDIIILGEGEETLASITQGLEKGCSINEACSPVDGVAWRDGNNIKKNDKTRFLRDLDSLPFPAWHLLDLKHCFANQKNLYELRPPFLTVLSSRGCPYACTFCNMYITHSRKWRFRSPKNFVDELEFLKRKYAVNHFFIADDNFSVDLDRAKDICREILNRRLDICYNASNGLSIKTLDKELLSLMKASGCGSVAMAIESGSERIRNEVYKKHLPTEKIYQAVTWCEEVGLPSIGFFMVGAPGENRQSIEETKKIIEDLPLTLCTCGVFTPYPGTALFDECLKKGYLEVNNPEDIRRLEFSTCILKTPDFSAEDVVAWQKEIYLHFLKTKWPKLLLQLIKPNGIVNLSQVGFFRKFMDCGFLQKLLPHHALS
ncbi:MAG: radical SAM protein [Candidatus Brocadiaceae bacterium]|nr:radical SAM protein [Candidatus Brocadiaceae bacterium]